MKMRWLAFLLIFLALPLSAEEVERSMSLSADTGRLLAGLASLKYERKLKERLALTVPVSVGYPWYWPLAIKLLSNDQKWTAKTTRVPLFIEAGAGLRYAPFHPIFEGGFSLEPRVTLAYSQFESEIQGVGKIGGHGLALHPQLGLGWDWYWESGLFLSLQGLLGYELRWVKGAEEPSAVKAALGKNFFAKNLLFPTNNGLSLGLNFMLGFAW